MSKLLAVYLMGVAIGLGVMRDAWKARLLTALLWPLGLVAFAVVLVLLVTASAYLWPIPVLGAAATIGAIVWLAS
jgi:hypothetical protein